MFKHLSTLLILLTLTACGGGGGNNENETTTPTLKFSLLNPSLQIPQGATTVTTSATLTAKDNSEQRINNAPINFTLSTTGSANVTPSITQGTTDTLGEIQLNLTASGSGTATLIANGLGSQATQNLIISDTNTPNPFRITSPSTEHASLIAGGVDPTDRLNVTVAADGITNVKFSSSIGTWLSTGTATATVAVNNDSATDTLIAAATDSGFAIVVVADTADAKVFDTMTVTMAPPATAAATISIQSNLNALPISLGNTIYTAYIEATVRSDNASGNTPIANVPVIFTLQNTPGGGETLSTGFSITDLNGNVSTQFSSGGLSSGLQAVIINASVVADTSITDSLDMRITGTGGTITMNNAASVTADTNNTAIYKLAMSAVVADSSSNPQPAADVSLTAWPISYRSGAWYDADPDLTQEKCAVYYSGPAFLNEDIDEDLILDVPSAVGPTEDLNQDGQLSPPLSSAGFLPTMAATDAAGITEYQLTFLKQYSRWIDVRVRATANVQGVKTSGTQVFNIPVLAADADNCNIAGDSPFDMVVTAAPGEIAAIVGATIVGAGTDPALRWTLPVFEANNNASWSATTGAMQIIPPSVSQPLNTAQYRVAANATSGSVYQDNISIMVDPLSCSAAACGPLTVSFGVKVIVN